MGYSTLQRIGNAVRHARLSRSLTQEQLAELTDTSDTYISSLERGQRNVTIKTLDKIAKACHIDLFQLLLLDELEDETITQLVAILMSRDQLDRERVLNIVREMYRTD